MTRKHLCGLAAAAIATTAGIAQACNPAAAAQMAAAAMGCLPCDPISTPATAVSAPAEAISPSAEPQTAGSLVVKQVQIGEFFFSDANVTIPLAGAVRWTNLGERAHTATHSSFPPDWDSGTMLTDDVFQHIFTSVGQFDYECIFHFGMNGSVTVRAAGDATGNNTVDIDDFSVLAGNFNETGGFSDGDFDLSGIVDIDDFGLLATNFNLSFGGLAGRGATVPEPASLTLALLTCATIHRRRALRS